MQKQQSRCSRWFFFLCVSSLRLICFFFCCFSANNLRHLIWLHIIILSYHCSFHECRYYKSSCTRTNIHRITGTNAAAFRARNDSAIWMMIERLYKLDIIASIVKWTFYSYSIDTDSWLCTRNRVLSTSHLITHMRVLYDHTRSTYRPDKQSSSVSAQLGTYKHTCVIEHSITASLSSQQENVPIWTLIQHELSNEHTSSHKIVRQKQHADAQICCLLCWLLWLYTTILQYIPHGSNIVQVNVSQTNAI